MSQNESDAGTDKSETGTDNDETPTKAKIEDKKKVWPHLTSLNPLTSFDPIFCSNSVDGGSIRENARLAINVFTFMALLANEITNVVKLSRSRSVPVLRISRLQIKSISHNEELLNLLISN